MIVFFSISFPSFSDEGLVRVCTENGIKLRFCAAYFKRRDLPSGGIIQTMCSSCKWLPVDINWQTWNNRRSQTRHNGIDTPCGKCNCVHINPIAYSIYSLCSFFFVLSIFFSSFSVVVFLLLWLSFLPGHIIINVFRWI